MKTLHTVLAKESSYRIFARVTATASGIYWWWSLANLPLERHRGTLLRVFVLIGQGKLQKAYPTWPSASRPPTFPEGRADLRKRGVALFNSALCFSMSISLARLGVSCLRHGLGLQTRVSRARGRLEWAATLYDLPSIGSPPSTSETPNGQASFGRVATEVVYQLYAQFTPIVSAVRMWQMFVDAPREKRRWNVRFILAMYGVMGAAPLWAMFFGPHPESYAGSWTNIPVRILVWRIVTFSFTIALFPLSFLCFIFGLAFIAAGLRNLPSRGAVARWIQKLWFR